MSAVAAAPVPVPVKAVRRAPRRRALAWCGLALVALPFLVEALRVLFGDNFHVLIPGRVYRCAYPSPARLEQLVHTYGIRTIINLRGCSDPWPWYVDETRVTHRLDLAQEDISFSAGRYPPTHELRRLLEVLERCEYPILLHCRQGADRTGLAAVLIMLLQTDVPLAEARRHMSPRYGHIPLGRPAILDRYLDLYTDWLKATQRTHSRAAVRAWLDDPGFPGDNVCRIEVLELPEVLHSGQPAGVRIRAHNVGHRPWELRAGSTAGVHAFFWIYDAEDRNISAGRAGLFDAVVPPRESIDLCVPLPALAPGKYLLQLDMIEEGQGYFFQTTSALVERTLVVAP
jgi:protein tyrosine phosphatase (PTP) superfamily phosphohydrolase (DUF442 family)